MRGLFLREYLFYIGIIVFSLTLFVEHLFSVDTDFTGFCKGLGVGLVLGGVIKLMTKKDPKFKDRKKVGRATV
jgi:predicted phage tail protein